MEKGAPKSRLLWAIGSMAALFALFLVCRVLFFAWHGMKQWPLALFVFGLVVIAIAALLGLRRTMLCANAGYIIGFALAMLFNADGVDPGGGRTNNAWIIWAAACLAIVLLGVVWDVANRRMKK